MTRVLALVTDAYGGRGGIAQVARDVVEALVADDAGAWVDVLPRHAKDAVPALPARVGQRRALDSKLAYTARAVFAALFTRPGVIFCNHLHLSPLGAILARIGRARLVVQLHGIEIWPAPSAAQRHALEAADLLVCVSRDTRARVIAHADIVPERAIVVNNTVSPRFTPGDRAAARQMFGLGDGFVLLSVGRLDASEQYKGHGQVIAAMAALAGTGNRPLLYLIAGDGDYRASLEGAAAKAGVARQVRFLGQVADADLPDLYRAADLFVLPSRGEGFGIVFLEAMACGTPAMGLAAGGAGDALGDGDLGTLVACDADLAIALAALIAAPAPPREALAARVAERFGTKLFRARIAQAFESLHGA